MAEKLDWYPATLAEERAMYANIEAKISAYAGKYPVLNVAYLAVIHTFCQAFIEAYDKIEQNRQTGRQATVWFDNLVHSKQENTVAPAPPVYLPIVMPENTLIGIEKACRDFRNLLVKQLNYDRADGLDLMLEREASEEVNLEESQPVLKLSETVSNAVSVEWKKTGFDMLELQYRKVGETMWQNVDKTTEKIIVFAPPITTPGVPEKFEFRAVYLIKNQRVGKWSATYTITVG